MRDKISEWIVFYKRYNIQYSLKFVITGRPSLTDVAEKIALSWDQKGKSFIEKNKLNKDDMNTEEFLRSHGVADLTFIPYLDKKNKK